MWSEVTGSVSAWVSCPVDDATFALPAAITAGATSVTFEARPVRRSGQAVVSEPFGVHEGEEITWSVPPQ